MRTLPTSPRGSSPRARGARSRQGGRVRGRGLIPASAGSTCTRWGVPPPREAHPRERGEHVSPTSWSTVGRGSSPRARGALAGGEGDRVHRRLIPASAGSTARRVPSAWSMRAHPRERGEHSGTPSASRAKAGSSPRARGAPQSSDVHPSPSPAHPRERGEHCRTPRSARWPCGSSPRARGARTRCLTGSLTAGLIPASAGSTSCGGPARWRAWAHPRERGEHGDSIDANTVGWGSSPRARGALGASESSLLYMGLIPASAGSTC